MSPNLRYEAERGALAGAAAAVGRTRKVDGLGGLASGREAVKLVDAGDSVEWIAADAANSIAIRNSIPDNNGKKRTGLIKLVAASDCVGFQEYA